MEIIEMFGEKLNRAGKEVQIWKDITQINSMIGEEKKKQQQLYAKLGEAYYNEVKDNVPDDYSETVRSISESISRVRNYVYQIEEIKRVRACSNCGAPLDRDAAFCPQCGEPVGKEEAKRRCTCGAEINEGDQFCAGCGKRLEN